MTDYRNSENIQAIQEKGYMVGVHVKGTHPLLSVKDSLDELSLLASTADIEVVGQTTQQVARINPSTFVGSGKLEEIREDIEVLEANVIIFDDELSPRHQRELEKVLGEDVKVIDRSALILDIFARHAQTREGALQVELAQYEYRLPRLTRQWTHLARQSGGGAARAGGGGVGLRGPGETQLEVDRREISRRISKLKEELESVRAHRGRHRSQRKQAGIPVVALVGYTNAGKSTLLNALSKADVYAADQLFATLDPTTRRIELGNGQTALCSDTVGFIQKLPTTLIAAFRATLEEIAEAQIILHVADSSHPNLLEQIEAVEETLATLDLPPVPRILALNKQDIAQPGVIETLPESVVAEYTAVLAVSARTEAGLDILLKQIERMFQAGMQVVHVLIPYERGDITAQLYERGIVLDEQHTSTGVAITARVKSDMVSMLQPYTRHGGEVD
jgi:GTP-binding protein HflX